MVSNGRQLLSGYRRNFNLSRTLIPVGAKVLGTALVLKQKKDIVKARICAQDFMFKKKRDDLFSPPPSVSSLRVLMAIAARKGYSVKTGDFSTAFLHVLLGIDEEVHVKAPKVVWVDGVPVFWKL